MNRSLLLLLCPALAWSFCWRPKTNPFVAPPVVTRIDRSRVRLDWSSAFSGENAADCAKVDFMVKSHPRFQASAYKLSDLTAKGQTAAVINVDAAADFVFQVIARENKGASHGIDYKYSSMVTSYATDRAGMAGSARDDDGDDDAMVTEPRRRIAVPATTTQRPRPASGLESDSAQRGLSSARRPQLRSMTPTSSSSIYDDMVTARRKAASTSAVASDVSRCTPQLDRMDAFGPGSNMRQDRIVISFIRYLNQRPMTSLREFLQTRKSCKESHKKGFEVQCPATPSTKMCCDSPWATCQADSETEVCFSSYFSCDGRCISREWVGDGWPDCVDGADEGGSDPTRVLLCLDCAGVVLPAAQLCRASGRELDAQCVHDFIGQGECNVCVDGYLK